MTEEYYEWLSQLLFSSLWQYEIPEDGDYLYYKWENGIMNDWVSYYFLVCGNMRYQMMVIICIINERRVLWMTSQLLFLVFSNMRYQMMVIICIINERMVLWMFLLVYAIWDTRWWWLFISWNNGIMNDWAFGLLTILHYYSSWAPVVLSGRVILTDYGVHPPACELKWWFICFVSPQKSRLWNYCERLKAKFLLGCRTV